MARGRSNASNFESHEPPPVPPSNPSPTHQTLPPPNPSSTHQTELNLDPLSQQLSNIASRLNAVEALAADVATLKAQTNAPFVGGTSRGNSNNRGKAVEYNQGPRLPTYSHWPDASEDEGDHPGVYRNSSRMPYTKMEFQKFDKGDPRGWILKVEKYFCYYQTPEELKVDVASMYLEGEALDLFAWINLERFILYWGELVKALQENFGPAEFQNPDEHLCGVKQTSSIQEYD